MCVIRLNQITFFFKVKWLINKVILKNYTNNFLRHHLIGWSKIKSPHPFPFVCLSLPNPYTWTNSHSIFPSLNKGKVKRQTSWANGLLSMEMEESVDYLFIINIYIVWNWVFCGIGNWIPDFGHISNSNINPLMMQ